MSAPWNPSTPLIKGNMSTLISNIVRTMEIMDIKLFKAIVIVLKRQIGASKYAELLTQNVSNGSNDQKRLVLMVAQAYRNSKKRPKRVENNFYVKINLLKNYEPMPSNPGLNHPVIFSKVQKAFNEALEKLDKYPWTGNVRELRNVIERLMILGDNPISAENIIQFAPK